MRALVLGVAVLGLLWAGCGEDDKAAAPTVATTDVASPAASQATSSPTKVPTATPTPTEVDLVIKNLCSSGLSGRDLYDLVNGAALGAEIKGVSATEFGRMLNNACPGTAARYLEAYTAAQSATAAPPNPAGPVSGDGTYRVGAEITPGTWRSSKGDGCYWARLRGFSGEVTDIIANQNATGTSTTVTIATSDVGFQSKGCGTWTKVQ